MVQWYCTGIQQTLWITCLAFELLICILVSERGYYDLITNIFQVAIRIYTAVSMFVFKNAWSLEGAN